MSNNYDMAYFNREQSVVGKDELQRPYVIDPSRLGYRPHYPEEEAQASPRLDLVAAARRRQEERPATAG